MSYFFGFNNQLCFLIDSLCYRIEAHLLLGLVLEAQGLYPMAYKELSKAQVRIVSVLLYLFHYFLLIIRLLL